LAIQVAAREGDSQYILSAHEPAALKAGLAQPAIDAAKYNKEASGLGEKETTVIRMGRQLLRWYCRHGVWAAALFRDGVHSGPTVAGSGKHFGNQVSRMPETEGTTASFHANYDCIPHGAAECIRQKSGASHRRYRHQALNGHTVSRLHTISENGKEELQWLQRFWY
jgi:hypothetical protein